MRPLARWISCLVLMGLGSGCARHEDPTPPLLDGEPTSLLICTPDSGNIGTVVAIEGMRFSVPAYVNVVVFANHIDLRPDSGTAERIFFTVPFGAGSGRLRVESRDSVAETGVFTVKETFDPGALQTAWYNLPTPITLRDSVVVDEMHVQRTWRASIRHDTVDIYRYHSSGEVWGEYHLTFVNRGTNMLPQPIVARFIGRWDTGGGIDTMRGVVKIQDWNPDAALSGRLFGNPYDRPLPFYVTAGKILR